MEQDPIECQAPTKHVLDCVLLNVLGTCLTRGSKGCDSMTMHVIPVMAISEGACNTNMWSAKGSPPWVNLHVQASCDCLTDANGETPKSHEILMFVGLQKDAKQCCDVGKLDWAHCSGRSYDRPEQ